MTDEMECRMAALRGDHSEDRCALCGAQAAHKIAEELRAPASMHEAVHELTATLCAGCFDRIFRAYRKRTDPDDDRAESYSAISGLRVAFLRLCDLFKRQRLREQDQDRALDSAVLALRDAIATLPCPQCHQTGWAHKMDCSQGDLERVASHPKSGGIMVHILKSDSLWDGSRRTRCPGCNEVDGGHLEGCTERGHE